MIGYSKHINLAQNVLYSLKKKFSYYTPTLYLSVLVVL